MSQTEKSCHMPSLSARFADTTNSSSTSPSTCIRLLARSDSLRAKHWNISMTHICLVMLHSSVWASTDEKAVNTEVEAATAVSEEEAHQ